MSTSEMQETQQAYGPVRPTVATLRAIFDKLPSLWEVHAVAINGQTGRLFVEGRYEGFNLSIKEFPLP